MSWLLWLLFPFFYINLFLDFFSLSFWLLLWICFRSLYKSQLIAFFLVILFFYLFSLPLLTSFFSLYKSLFITFFCYFVLFFISDFSLYKSQFAALPSSFLCSYFLLLVFLVLSMCVNLCLWMSRYCKGYVALAFSVIHFNLFLFTTGSQITESPSSSAASCSLDLFHPISCSIFSLCDGMMITGWWIFLLF